MDLNKSMAGDLSVFRIQGDQSMSSFAGLSALGVKPLLQDIMKERVAVTANLGQSALKSMAPVDNFELLNSINIRWKSDYERTVIVPGTHRTTSKTQDQLFNAQLAEILEKGILPSTGEQPKKGGTFKRTNPRTGRKRIRRINDKKMKRRKSTPSLDGFPSGQKGNATEKWIADAQKNLVDRLT